MYNKQGCGYYFSFVGISPEVSLEQGIAKSGGERLRLDISARFNIRSSIELLC